MGTIVAAERPQPVAWLARDLGANRQNVQRSNLHRSEPFGKRTQRLRISNPFECDGRKARKTDAIPR